MRHCALKLNYDLNFVNIDYTMWQETVVSFSSFAFPHLNIHIRQSLVVFYVNFILPVYSETLRGHCLPCCLPPVNS